MGRMGVRPHAALYSREQIPPSKRGLGAVGAKTRALGVPTNPAHPCNPPYGTFLLGASVSPSQWGDASPRAQGEVNDNIPIKLYALEAREEKARVGWDTWQPAASPANPAETRPRFPSLCRRGGRASHRTLPAYQDSGAGLQLPLQPQPDSHREKHRRVLSSWFRFLQCPRPPPNPQTILHIFKFPLLFSVLSPPPLPPKKRERNYKSPSFVSVPAPHLSGRRARRLE